MKKSLFYPENKYFLLPNFSKNKNTLGFRAKKSPRCPHHPTMIATYIREPTEASSYLVSETDSKDFNTNV